MIRPPSSLFEREILEDVRNRRSLAAKMIVPIAFVIPFSVDLMPLSARASILPLLALFLGVLGSSVGLTRWQEGKVTERIATLPLSRKRMMLDYVLANAVMDGAQMVVPAAIMFLSLGLTAESVSLAVAALALCLLLSNALGAFVAGVSGGSGETHLLSIVTVLAVAALSGLFMGGMTSTFGQVSGSIPFGLLGGVLGSGVGDSAVLQLLLSSAVTALALWLVLRFAPRMFRA